MAAGDEETEQERQSGEGAAGDQGYDARGRVALAEVGEYIETGDDAKEDDRPEIDGGVAAEEKEDQVFAGVADRPSLPWRISRSCWTRSIGTGKTITVLRSTPISVRVCR